MFVLLLGIIIGGFFGIMMMAMLFMSKRGDILNDAIYSNSSQQELFPNCR
jgi:cytosine/uracil/thiamine/allantoin permease